MENVTVHAFRRCAQRQVDNEAIEMVIRHGRKVHRTGVVFYFLGRRDLPEALRRQDRYAKLEGLTLLVSQDGEVITAYRNRAACRKIRKKLKYRAIPPQGDPFRSAFQAQKLVA